MRHAGEEPRRRTRRRGLVAFGACILAAVLLPPVALASNHLVKLREVYAGSSTHPGDEYVEVQMYATGQNFFSDGVSLHLYDAAGNQTLAFAPKTDLPNGQTQRRVLFATASAQST